MFFVAHDQVPNNRLKDVSYGRIVVGYRPQKEEPHRTRLTAGRVLIDYAGYVRTPTADITTAKIIINSTISTSGARYMCCDIKNFDLGTTLIRYEYIKYLLIYYQMISSRNITSVTLYTPVIYTMKFEKECTGSHRQESLPISNWSEDRNPGGMHHASTHEAYGSTNGDLSYFHWWLMSLGSNILEKNTQNTF